MPDKLPWMKFWVQEWLSDEQLGTCTPATRGIWIDVLCLMHKGDRTGKLTGTRNSLARICRCTEKEFSSACEELNRTGTAGVSIGHVKVTLMSRRMSRTCHARELARKRKVTERSRPRHADVTPGVTVQSKKSETETEKKEEDKEKDSKLSSVDHHLTRLLCGLILTKHGKTIKDGSPEFNFIMRNIMLKIRQEYENGEERIKTLLRYYRDNPFPEGVSIADKWGFKNHFDRLEGWYAQSPEGMMAKTQATVDRLGMREDEDEPT